jgi:NHL repeat
MKTEFLIRTNPMAGFARAGLRTAAAAAALALCAGNLLANSVAWISGGPNAGYPSGAGYVDGDMTDDAEYNTPSGLAIDVSGDNLLVADRNNNAVRVLQFSINTTGTLLCYTNGVEATNLFTQPIGVAIDPNYNIFVLSRGTGKNGYVLEFDYTGELIATNLSGITNAEGIAIDQNDNVFVTASNRVFEAPVSGPVSTLATITATNSSLGGIVVKHNGLLAVCDTGRNGVLLINPVGGVVSTNAGFHGAGDFVSLTDTAFSNTATLFQPSGITESGDGTLIITDFGNDRVKAVLANGNITNVYGVTSNDWVSPWPGFEDGTVALPDKPGGVAGRSEFGVVLAPDGSLYVSEDYYHIIRHVTGTPFIPEPIAPTAPTGVTATVVTNAGAIEVKLQWTPSSSGNVTNYVVERSPSSGGPYSVIGTTSGTTFFDTGVGYGTTYYYVIQAQGGDSESPNSQPEAVVTTPTLPPPPPTIGWFDYEFNVGADEFLSTFHPLTNGAVTVNNDLSYTIEQDPTVGETFYSFGPTPLAGSPATNGTSFGGQYVFQPNSPAQQTPLPITPSTNLTIKAVTENTEGQFSAVSSAQVIYQCGAPGIIAATNAALFYLSDITTNVVFFYTTDGTDPLTNQLATQEIVATNSIMAVGLNISSNFVFSVRAFRGNYLPSGLVTNLFLGQNFQGDELTWGFASGYCSSTFVGSPGEIFYAPVTLSTLPNAVIYSAGFDMTVTNLGPDPVPSGAFAFDSMLKQPGTLSNTVGTVLFPIPPLEFAGDFSSPPPPGQLVTYNGTNFVNLAVPNTNLNELAIAWVEMFGKTNLYNTSAQSLISLSQAFIEVIPDGQHPNQTIVGGYKFQIPTNAQPGERYQIQLQNPSGDNDGMGIDGSAVIMNTPTSGSLSNGPINSIKIVTVGQPKYMAGDVYPFEWFNAGNFGNGDLTYWIDDVQEVFDAVVYDLNVPPAGSDFADAMDSAGGFGAYDTAAGYWTNSNVIANSAQRNALFNVNDSTTINTMAFGDGTLDICDVWVTFLRANFPNLYWFQRFYTNDPVNGVFGRVAMAITSHTNVNGAVSSPSGGGSPLKSALGSSQGPVSITNTPTVHFAAGDYLASAGQTLQIPVTANVYGLNPLRMLMFNVDVTPLDGSPALTTSVSFSPNAPFNNSSIYNPPTSLGLATNSTGNCAAAFLPTTFPISASAGILGSNVIGYLNISIPANATSSSAYALSFGHASGSPNGLVSFPKTTYTGLITLSSRTSSSYNDGIPDSWRLRYFGTIYNQLSVSNADADGTGMNNWQKYLAGLDPTDPTSVLNEGTDQPMAQSSQDHVIYWPSVNGQTYIIKRSAALFSGQWTAISTNIGDGTYMEIHDAAAGPNSYYQVTTP